jgi:hypothetical protein
VPFRSTDDNANSLLGEHMQLAMDVIAVMLPQTQQNVSSLCALAVTSQSALGRRAKNSPDLHRQGFRDRLLDRDARTERNAEPIVSSTS